MIVSVPKETFPGERRVALVPAMVPPLTRAGLEVRIESGAGESAGYLDEHYAAKGATVTASLDELFAADVILQVRTAGANPQAGVTTVERLREGHTVIGLADPLGRPEAARRVVERGAALFALEQLPRITR
ncbi:MAG: NAD(P)(+) transhydrogenase (Re/Si-specific) subunit alpha, partial [Pirellulales bacterium]